MTSLEGLDLTALDAHLREIGVLLEGRGAAYERLSTLERDLLKDALAVVKRFKTTIRHHFKMTGF